MLVSAAYKSPDAPTEYIRHQSRVRPPHLRQAATAKRLGRIGIRILQSDRRYGSGLALSWELRTDATLTAPRRVTITRRYGTMPARIVITIRVCPYFSPKIYVSKNSLRNLPAGSYSFSSARKSGSFG